MAAELGNDYAAKGRRVEKLIERALKQEDDKRLRAGVEKLLDAVSEGERWALEFVTDRLDGKPRQAVDVGGQGDNPLVTEIVLKVVNANH